MSKNSGDSSFGFFGMLTILFIGLKLTNYIDWSWWYVLLPVYLPIILVFICTFIFIFFSEE